MHRFRLSGYLVVAVTSSSCLVVLTAPSAGCAAPSAPPAAARQQPLATRVQSDADFGSVQGEEGSTRLRLTADQLSGEARDMTAEELAVLTASKPDDLLVAPFPTEGEKRARLVEQALELEADASVVLLVGADDDASAEDWPALARDLASSGPASSPLLAARKARVAARMAPVAALGAKLGWSMGPDIWLATAVSVRLAASEVAGVVSVIPADFHVSLDTQRGGGITTGYRGSERRAATASSTLIVTGGYTGATGHLLGASSSPVRIGIIEPNLSLIYDHPVFKVGTGSALRWAAYRDCTSPPCVGWWPSFKTLLPFGAAHHASLVSQLAFGSVENGQDPAWTGAVDRLNRSGAASGATPYFYGVVVGASSRIAALQDATASGVDFVNGSYEDNANCAALEDLTDLGAMQTAQIMGTIYVKAAGNITTHGLNATTCSIGVPAQSRAGLTVGGLQTDPVAQAYNTSTIMHSDPTPPPDTLPGDGTLPGEGQHGTARGGGDVTVNGYNHGGVVSYVDFVAPAVVDMGTTYLVPPLPAPQVRVRDYLWNASGTSAAAPIVTGGLALFSSWAKAAGWPLTPRQMQASAILTADGWSYRFNAKTETNFDFRSGAGRWKNHSLGWPSNLGYWGYSCVNGNITSGVVVSYDVGGSTAPEPSTVQTWKAVLTWDEVSRANAADLDLSVVDTCPPGGGVQNIAADTSRDLRSRIRIEGPKAAGKCLQAKVHAYHVPAGQSRYYTLCHYYQSDNTSEH